MFACRPLIQINDILHHIKTKKATALNVLDFFNLPMDIVYDYFSPFWVDI